MRLKRTFRNCLGLGLAKRPTGFFVLTALAALSAAQSYTVTPIAPYYGLNQGIAKFRINELGQVTGAAVNPADGIYSGFLWTPTSPNGTTGSIRYLPRYSNYQFTEAYGLNNLGDVVGRAANSPSPPLPKALYWPTSGGVHAFSVGSTQTEFLAINDSREMLAWARQKANSPMGTNVVKLVSGKWKIFFLGNATPQDINSSGQVLSVHDGNGSALFTPNGAHTSWTKQTIVPYGGGWDLNNAGEVAGFFREFFPGPYPDRPYIYLPAAKYGMPAGVNDLWGAVLAGVPGPSDPNSIWRTGFATAVNDNGVVLGDVSAQVHNGTSWVTIEKYAWIWDSWNGTRLIQDLLVGTGWSLAPSVGNPAGLETQYADEWAINNMGQIVCKASNDGGFTYRTVLLTPQ